VRQEFSTIFVEAPEEKGDAEAVPRDGSSPPAEKGDTSQCRRRGTAEQGGKTTQSHSAEQEVTTNVTDSVGTAEQGGNTTKQCCGSVIRCFFTPGIRIRDEFFP
jgi:hypothetical protein